VATGVDVTRAETRVAAERVRLSQAETNAQRARLDLLRTIGLPLSSDVTLTDPLGFRQESLPEEEVVVTEAGRGRLEVRIAEEQLRLSGYNLGATKAEGAPSVDFVADYGESGTTPTQNAVPTRTVGVRMTIPLFDMGRKGRITAAQSRQRQAELKLNDIRTQVEEDVRLALQTVTTTAAQARAAQQEVSLAERELQMARDRFSAGVADNLEVISAQTSLANARESEVSALAQYNAARINLASAWGRVEAFQW
jgi:outer membrane protein TolC